MGWRREEVSVKLLGNILWRTKLACAVIAKSWDGEQPSCGGDRPQPPALRLVDVPEKPDRFPRNIDGAPYVHVEHLPRLFLGSGLNFTLHGQPGIVVNDIDATESSFRGPERVFDVIGVGYIDLEDQKLVLCPRLEQMVKRLRLSHSGNNDVTLLQCIRSKGQTKARGCAGDCVLW